MVRVTSNSVAGAAVSRDVRVIVTLVIQEVCHISYLLSIPLVVGQ